MNPPAPQNFWHQNTRYIAKYINVQQNSSPNISYSSMFGAQRSTGIWHTKAYWVNTSSLVAWKLKTGSFSTSYWSTVYFSTKWNHKTYVRSTPRKIFAFYPYLFTLVAHRKTWLSERYGPVRSISFRGIESYVVHNSGFWGMTLCCFTNQHGVKPDNLFNNEANASNHTSVKLTPRATLT